MRTFAIVGPGRAGRSFEGALKERGWECQAVVGRGEALELQADLVLLCVPDRAIEEVASHLPEGEYCVAHVSGSKGLSSLLPHKRRAVIHPFIPLPDELTGKERLLSGCYFRIAGDGLAREVVKSLGGKVLEISEENAPYYHLLGSVSANLVASLVGYCAMRGEAISLPRQALAELGKAALEDLGRFGLSALTGPLSRGDEETIIHHEEVLKERDPGFLPLYRSLVALAREAYKKARGDGAS